VLDLRRGSNRAASSGPAAWCGTRPTIPRGRRFWPSWRGGGRHRRQGLIEPLARQDPDAAGQVFPESLRSLYALTLHRKGDTRRAAELWRAAAASAHRSLDSGAESYNAPMELAAISAIEGHTDAALEWLERGYRAGWKDARFLNLDPFFASVRREPRYQALATAMTQTWRR